MFYLRSASVLVVVLVTGGLVAIAQDYSVDSASPEFPTVTAADVVLWAKPGFGTRIPAADLGLGFFDEVDAFSYGQDELKPWGTGSSVFLIYSVDRATVGDVGVVFAETGGNGAAGDEFAISGDSNGVAWVGPWLWRDSTAHGLSPLPTESDEDGVDVHTWITSPSVYLTLDATTAGWYSVSPADVFYQATPGPGAPFPALYASEATLGLSPGDVIDALAVLDVGTVGTLDPGDVVWVSLAPGSPTLTAFTSSPGSIWEVYPGFGQVFAHTALDLLFSDNLNALTADRPSTGDLNCDGVVNNFDILPFVMVLTDTPPNYPVYYGAYPNCNHLFADCNWDGVVSNFDINPFVVLLTSK